MAGQWIFLALSALAGILHSLENHFLVWLFSILLFARVVYTRKQRILISAAGCFLAFFLVTEKAKLLRVTHFPSPGSARLSVTFKETPQIDGDRLKAIVTTSEQEKLMLVYRMKSKQEKQQIQHHLQAGNICHLEGILSRPQSKRNMHAFHYEQYLKRKQIYWLFEPDHFSPAVCQKSSFSALHFLKNARSDTIKRMNGMFPERVAAYGEALIFGDRDSISEEANEGYRRLGVVHLLAISGLHVGLIVGASIFVLLRAGCTWETVYCVMLVWLPLYGFVSGGNPPVVRAVLMALLIFSAKRWRLPLSTLDALSISFLLFLFVDPYVVYHIGFQLSYAVSFGIILSVPLFRHLHSFWQMIHISMVSLLSSLPILSFHFHEFSIISLFANLLFIPFYTLFLLPVIFVLFCLSFVLPPFSGYLAIFLDKVLAASENVAIWTGSFPFATVVTGKPSLVSIIFMTVGVFIYFLLTERKYHPVLSVFPLVLVLVIHCFAIRFSPYGKVVFIDVGQGDSVLIKLPYNRGTYLIDTGGQLFFPKEEWQERNRTFQVGTDILLPVLRSHGIKRIDKLILTHSDVDHIGATRELMEKISIGKVYITPNSWEKPLMLETVRLAKEKKITVREVKAGYGWKNKSGTFQMIYPFDDQYEGNNDSLVLYGKFGGMTWLFMGDVEKEGEEELIAVYSRLRADVIKVSHHGSKTSTIPSFVEQIKPKYAVISAGQNNRYGHPHPEVLETLENNGVRIFRTDLQGAVHFTFGRSKKGTFQTILQYDISDDVRHN
ncbi:competence protein ComEC [Bacillus thermophilus]|uniref:Competence protein ComEC n=1 Tax=Siminovitchia thermophila TaxID=1245522 RepID=A0ABS2RAX7_9BACI|nr:DNA internalization-related competence protein ComEC/Rec2 [Siminovitchia thermophila]MBM7716329.1 competence protein ComEC [Siminovitchia thermophila]ONK24179.1 DNA internalization-related competence protein ComEC/Rec2 [Bacillus sp. VT-16-64]